MIIQCAWCFDVKDAGGEYKPLASPRKLRGDIGDAMGVSHGICEPCAVKFLDEIENDRRAARGGRGMARV